MRRYCDKTLTGPKCASFSAHRCQARQKVTARKPKPSVNHAIVMPIAGDGEYPAFRNQQASDRTRDEGATISGGTVWKWLREDALRAWLHRSWVFPRDPDFETRTGPVLDLYQGVWEGKELRPNECVISADERTSIQARIRRHPTQPCGVHRSMRLNRNTCAEGS